MMYGRVLDADYTTSMGVAVEHEAVDTLIGRVGFVLGKLFKTPISERWGKQICLNE